MNLQGLVDAVSSRGYTYTQNLNDPANPIVQAINSGYRTVCGAQSWPFLEKEDSSLTTSVGTSTYDLSSITDLRQVDAVRLESDGLTYELKGVAPQHLKSRIASYWPTAEGQPEFWAVYGGKLLLWPTPDAAYTLLIDYICNVTDLSTATDEPIIPSTYHDILVWFAIQELAYRERQPLDEASAQQSYELAYRQMQEAYFLRQRQNSSTVVKSGCWGPA